MFWYKINGYYQPPCQSTTDSPLIRVVRGRVFYVSSPLTNLGREREYFTIDSPYHGGMSGYYQVVGWDENLSGGKWRIFPLLPPFVRGEADEVNTSSPPPTFVRGSWHSQYSLFCPPSYGGSWRSQQGGGDSIRLIYTKTNK